MTSVSIDLRPEMSCLRVILFVVHGSFMALRLSSNDILNQATEHQYIRCPQRLLAFFISSSVRLAHLSTISKAAHELRIRLKSSAFATEPNCSSAMWSNLCHYFKRRVDAYTVASVMKHKISCLCCVLFVCNR